MILVETDGPSRGALFTATTLPALMIMIPSTTCRLLDLVQQHNLSAALCSLGVFQHGSALPTEITHAAAPARSVVRREQLQL